MGIFGFPQKETGAESVTMGTTGRCHSVSFVMYFSGAKFEEDCSNISGDIECCTVLEEPLMTSSLSSFP